MFIDDAQNYILKKAIPRIGTNLDGCSQRLSCVVK